MARTSEFVNHLLDLLAPLGGVSARRMFGGWGFYRNSQMFAIVADEVFYVKVDDPSRASFTEQSLVRFGYETGEGRRHSLSYYTVPTEALDSSPLLCEWAQHGLDAAARAAAAKKPARKKSAPPTRPKPATQRRKPRH